MSPFAGYGLRFFTSPKLYTVISFKHFPFVKDHYFEGTLRYDKTNAIFNEGGHVNCLLGTIL